MTGVVIGLVTCARRAEARKLARLVLERKLAACVNIVAGIESHYWWQGRLDHAAEWLLVIKTTRAKTAALTRVVKQAHSYEVPEIIFTPVVAGERRYLKWLRGAISALLLCATAYADPMDDLIRQLGSTNEEVRAEAAQRLVELGGPRAEAQFRKMIESGNPETRQTGVVGLLQVSGADEDVQRVRQRLQDSDSGVRWSAALALGQSGRAEAVPWLEEVAGKDAVESVREAATEALTRLRAGIPWQPALPSKPRQPVLVYFTVAGSDYCRRFEEGVLADAAVVKAARGFVCVRLDGARHAAEAKRLDVRGAPTLVVLDANGQERGRVTGLADKATVLARLAERRPVADNPRDVAANWRAAQAYLDEDRADLAEPCLRNVIANDAENQYGYTDDALFALGFALGQRGQHAAAAEMLGRLLERWPQFPEKDKALYCLGLSRLANGQRDAGRAALEQLLKEFPASPMAAGAKQALVKLEPK